LGLAVPWMMDNGPQTATWLTSAEKETLLTAISTEEAAQAAATNTSIAERTPTGTLATLAATYFMLMIGLYELGFWTPRLISSFGVSLRALGWLNALPYLVGALLLLPWCRMSDRSGNRRMNLLVSFLCGTVGFAATAFAPSLPVCLLGLALASFGVYVSMPVFWAATSQRLSPAAAAFGIAVINSIGNVGGFIGPYVTGWLLGRTHSYADGLLATAAALAIGAALAWIIFTLPRTSTSPKSLGDTA
jgi:ACS family tartrate transporter-like MFS transporter